VAQVSLLRSGFLQPSGFTAKPRSQKRDLGHPLFYFALGFMRAALLRPWLDRIELPGADVSLR
jgi:hypothetical protein